VLLPLEGAPLCRWTHKLGTTVATLWCSVEASGVEERLRGEPDRLPKLQQAMAAGR